MYISTTLSPDVPNLQDGVLLLREKRFYMYDDEGKKVCETRTTVSELKEDEVIQVCNA